MGSNPLEPAYHQFRVVFLRRDNKTHTAPLASRELTAHINVDGDSLLDALRDDAEALEELHAPPQLLPVPLGDLGADLHVHLPDPPTPLLIPRRDAVHGRPHPGNVHLRLLQAEKEAGAEAVTYRGRQDLRGVGARIPSQGRRLIHDEGLDPIHAEVHVEDEPLLPDHVDVELFLFRHLT